LIKTNLKTFACLTLFSLSLKAQGFNQQPSGFLKNESTIESSKLGIKSLRRLQIEEATIDSLFSVYSFDELQDRSQLVQLAIVPHVKINLLKSLEFRAMGLIGLSTGRVQTRFDNPQFGSMNLNELVLAFHPIEKISLELGALNQNDLNTPMLILDRAFPGLMVRGDVKVNSKFKAQLKAQYSIPNSVSYETDRTNNEPIPAFLTQGFDFDWKALDWLEVTGNVHHFTYNNLPSVVAFQSGRLGNEVSGTQSSQSFFAYGFDGFSQSYNFDFLISEKFVPKLDVQIVDNTKAPTSRSRSQWTGIGFDWFLKDLIISPSFAYFFAESDSAPALYSDVRLGRNNREGLSYKLKVNFKNSGFSLSANYIQANLIEPDPIQNNLRTFEFLLELPSVKF
jgi:hypothetical protein